MASNWLKGILMMGLVTFFFLYIQLLQPSTYKHIIFHQFSHPPAIRMAIINAVYYHNEVWYSYMYAAVVRCQWHISLFTVFLPEKLGYKDSLYNITRSWTHFLLSTPQRHVSQLVKSIPETCSHQIIVICSVERSNLQSILDIVLNKCDKRMSYIVLVQLHRASIDIPLYESIFKKFSGLSTQDRVKVRYLALAEHVKEFALHKITIPFDIDIWRPGFLLDLPVHTVEDYHSPYYDFIIQGKIEQKRRNYSGFANEIQRHRDTLNQHKVRFTIIGNGKSSRLHKHLKSSGVRLLTSRQYIPADIFFNYIHQAAGIIPTFSAGSYYIDVQSSTIFCAILTQTPFLASQRLLHSQKYIPYEAVWIKHDNETDIEAILRIIRSFSSVTAFRQALFMKRQRLKQLLEESYVSNEHTLNNYASLLKERKMYRVGNNTFPGK